MTVAAFIIMSFSVYPAGIAGAIRFNKTDPAFNPFIICTWLACLQLTSVYIISRQGLSSAAVSNSFMLVTVLLMNRQAKNWKGYNGYNKLYLANQALCIMAWLVEIYNANGSQQIQFYCRLFLWLVIFISSMHTSTRVLISHKKGLLLNPVFLVCSGYLFFLVFTIPADALQQYGTVNSILQQHNIDSMLAWVHLPVNILFLTAIICIPPKPRYIIL